MRGVAGICFHARGSLHREGPALTQPTTPLISAEHLVPLSSIEELRRRPHFKAPIDPRQHKLVEVLKDYIFDNEVPCGLSTCKQGHLKGFLVRTESGVETNIGHVCGKRQFGEDFDVASARFNRAKEHRNALARLDVLKGQAIDVIRQLQEQVDAPFGLRWVYAVRDAVRDRVGRDAFDHFVTRSKRDEYDVDRVEERSETEIRRIMREHGVKREQVQYRTEPVGRLTPMQWLWWDFRFELLNNVREPFTVIRDLDATALDTKTLQRWLRPLGGWESRVRTAQKHLDDARRFLDPANLAVADVAIEEFLKATRVGRDYRRLSEWPSSEHFATFARGSALPDAAPTIAARPKPLSKGQLRKNKRKGR